MPGVRRLALHARMRQSLPHNQPLCVGAHQRLVEWPGIAVIRGPPAQAVNARHLDPAFAVGEVTQQALKTRGPGAGGRISATRMVDHERQFDLPQRGDGVGKVLDVDPELQVPAERAYLPYAPRGVRGAECPLNYPLKYRTGFAFSQR